ncbi:hypothetical protein [Pseudoxanthomonas sp. Root630]|uniref:hypothetical protein n=1 Tax=Pseudoxanthomonas sp. Root630 TaxID=1736574 RepID=UPI0012DFC577|nr:hypothetical protein [Pseudoxanthomonas sp. Root630]
MIRSITFGVLLVALLGCATHGRASARDGLAQLAAQEDKKEVCIEFFRNRLDHAFGDAFPEMSRQALLKEILARLPTEENHALERVALHVEPVDGSTPDSQAIPAVMGQLVDEFKAAALCRDSRPELAANIFADQLNSVMVRRGLDTDRLFPPHGDWQGVQTEARILVALVAQIQADRDSKKG